MDFTIARGSGKQPAIEPSTDVPQRVLVAVGGHLGDAVISTAILPDIKRAWPDAEIGMLVGSWARAPLEGHPDIARVHTWDHWKTNRAVKGRIDRVRKHVSSRAQALREIIEVGYDIAIDLNPYFPNTIPLLWRSGIPIRVGYPTGGFAPLLTHSVAWNDGNRQRVDYHADLLREAGIPLTTSSRRYSLRSDSKRVKPSDGGGPDRDYLVLHMGAGLSLKEWPIEKWQDLVGALLADGEGLVFTGKGETETEMADAAIQNRSGCVNLCDRIDWHEFVSTVANARAVVCIDSAAGHVAAAVGTPAVVLFSGMNRIEHWTPLGESVVPITNPVPCAPCFRSNGCPQMSCIREITVETVLTALAGLSGRGTSSRYGAGNSRDPALGMESTSDLVC